MHLADRMSGLRSGCRKIIVAMSQNKLNGLNYQLVNGELQESRCLRPSMCNWRVPNEERMRELESELCVNSEWLGIR